MNIRRLCYELSKINWMRRISYIRQMDSMKDYYMETDKDFMEEYSFNDYIGECGYQGELYVCYDEFLEAEYLDREFMEELLDNDDLIAEYRKDLEENY